MGKIQYPRKRTGKVDKQQWNFNGVIVTVYKESSTAGPRHPRTRKIRATHSNPTSRSCGYDRRAELLAYVHHLRNVGPHHIHQAHSPENSVSPKPKKKKRLLARLEALKFSFRRIFGAEKNTWNYESIETIDCSKYRSCPSHHQGGSRWSKMFKKFRHVLKQFSCGCKCGKGFEHYDEQRQDLNSTI